MNRPRIVRALGDAPHRNLNCVYDSVRKRYLVPANLPRKPLWMMAISRLLSFKSHERVAILDTGLLSNHPWLKRRIVGAVDFTGEGVEDRNGHGTAVALVLLAGTPYVNLLNVKVLYEDADGTEEDLVEGLRWAAKNRATSINVSLGIHRPCDGSCDVCSEANRIVKECGILISAAAGNDGLTCPARASEVLSVGGKPTVQFEPIGRWGLFKGIRETSSSKVLLENEREVELFNSAQENFRRGLEHGKDRRTVSLAIDEFRESAKTFAGLNQTVPAAISRTYLGSQLVNRAWTPPNTVNFVDVAEAEQVLSEALINLSNSKDQNARNLEANALAWRARARTLLANRDLSKNELALSDASRAVSLLPRDPDTPEAKHDAAIAHLHF